jgi:hypothetical protein
MLAQPHSYYYPYRSLKNQINYYNNNGTGGGSDKPVPYTLPQPLGKNNRGKSNENASELERDI